MFAFSLTTYPDHEDQALFLLRMQLQLPARLGGEGWLMLFRPSESDFKELPANACVDSSIDLNHISTESVTMGRLCFATASTRHDYIHVYDDKFDDLLQNLPFAKDWRMPLSNDSLPEPVQFVVSAHSSAVIATATMTACDELIIHFPQLFDRNDTATSIPQPSYMGVSEDGTIFYVNRASWASRTFLWLYRAIAKAFAVLNNLMRFKRKNEIANDEIISRGRSTID